MTHLAKSALVPRPAATLYALVGDVASYPRLFDWCESATVLERSHDGIVARLKVRMAGLSAEFTTRNRHVPDESIALELVDGPFSALSGRWRFQPLGDGAGCKVSLTLDFEMAGKLVGSALAIGFRGFANHLVDDFVRVAKAGGGR